MKRTTGRIRQALASVAVLGALWAAAGAPIYIGG